MASVLAELDISAIRKREINNLQTDLLIVNNGIQHSQKLHFTDKFIWVAVVANSSLIFLKVLHARLFSDWAEFSQIFMENIFGNWMT